MAVKQIAFEPEWYKARQQAIWGIQRDCFGYCPPELKRKDQQLCSKHYIATLTALAQCERDRAADFIDQQGHPELADMVRGLR